MSEVERRPWDQLDDEPRAAYARFLIYRNLGPSRAIDAAYKSSVGESRKKPCSSGRWFKDSSKYGWVERAHAWDIAVLTDAGQRTVVSFLALLEEIAKKTLAAINDIDVKPEDWKQVVDATNILGSFIPSETVEAIQNYAERGGVPAIGAPDGKRE